MPQVGQREYEGVRHGHRVIVAKVRFDYNKYCFYSVCLLWTNLDYVPGNDLELLFVN